jgi:hypothetical protein
MTVLTSTLAWPATASGILAAVAERVLPPAFRTSEQVSAWRA